MNPSDSKTIGRYDKSGMLGIIEGFPEQVSSAGRIGMEFQAPDGLKIRYANIVSTGLGGSAIGADIARSYLSEELGIPMSVNRNYTLPRFVGEESLVIASSYSGNTEETLAAYEDAKQKKAKVVAITSGGELKERAGRDNVPAIIIPKGLPPRCALGYSFFPLLILLSKLGLIKDKSKDIDETIEVLNDLKLNRGLAKDTAKKIYLKYPLIYAGQDHIDSVATRWRTQLAENAKTLASTNLFPEMCHNEIVGIENPKKLLKDIIVIILRDPGDHPRVSKRMDIIKGIIGHKRVKVIEVKSSGRSLLARIFSLIYTGDFVSYYLAILNREDPTPVKRIDYLKERLAKEGAG